MKGISKNICEWMSVDVKFSVSSGYQVSYIGPSGSEECRTVSSHQWTRYLRMGVEGGESETVIRVEKVKLCFKTNEPCPQHEGNNFEIESFQL